MAASPWVAYACSMSAENGLAEPGERRDDQRPLVAGGPELGGSGNGCPTHLVGLAGSGRHGAWQLIPQVAGDRLFRFPLPAEQTAGLDVDGRRSAERVGRSWPTNTSGVVEHQPGGLPVAACHGVIEHRCARGPAGRPAARSQPRSKRTGGAARPALGDRGTELAPECTPAQSSRERRRAGHDRSLDADACTLDA